ncbi:RidA family protein [Cupriavidus agavae]|uniref:Enamine deaminase RidA (YjgF/YER057c/UK114 family) n=1 Tax=Cupriavidus agavae TaxID=1001822 RepID=A0A4Q7RZB3_9BURK|nr:RidA family protein [Cupriavidus agavae]RZT39195.1 enamine deaminase RidA (YjgF/YER057c/UK114 family) [Cupriavidus agavae]
MDRPDIYARLKTLGITLPAAASPAAAYTMCTQSGQLAYLSGHLAKRGGAVWTGRLGDTLTTQDGRQAAQAVAVDLLATLHAQLNDLNLVRRVVKLTSLVNSTPSYTDQHLVTNGASEFLVEVFGESGRHARSAFGVTQLPLDACLEIELIVELH